MLTELFKTVPTIDKKAAKMNYLRIYSAASKTSRYKAVKNQHCTKLNYLQ